MSAVVESLPALDILILIALLTLGLVLLLLKSFTANALIRKKLRLGVILTAIAILLGLTEFTLERVYGPPEGSLTTIQGLIAAFVLITVTVSLVFNRFSDDRTTGKFPPIVQDTIVVGCFVIAAVCSANCYAMRNLTRVALIFKVESSCARGNK
ncbi:MAG: hypothetical protein ACE5JX_13460 [Acidobacteriota bacterium]